ncbi:MAG TPA: aldolase/citrate lyase family protein [Planctomycetota bacterium]|nr:aldolase/citrate lyase family protein [Planctomycetota bacterium]
MKHDAVKALRATLAADRPAYGLWVTMESPSITEMAVGLGLDWVVIDAEHGHLDWAELVAHVRATVRSATVCLIRLATLDAGLIKRALDIGADGVVLPWMESAAHVRAALHAARYPGAGRRGIGAERATAWGRCIAEHVAEAGDALVVPLIESVEGGARAAEMAAIDGVDLFFIGPADWSATAGQAGGWAGPAVQAQIADACAAIRAAGKQVGVVATSDDDLRRRRHDGFRFLALGLDGALLLRALDGMIAATGTLRALTTALSPRVIGTSANPLSATPPGIACERPARVVTSAQAPRIELDDGAVVTAFVGRHCAARDLTAAVVRFAPGGTLVRHVHAEPETVVVIAGAVVSECDGRRFRLGPGDSIVIPAGMPHRTGNADAAVDAVIHTAMPADAIARSLAPPAGRIDDATTGDPVQRARDGATNDHTGRGRVRCLSLRLSAGETLSARLHAVDCAIVVVSGRVRCRTPRECWTVEAASAIHLPRGVAHELLALDAAHLIETCGDAEPLDAMVDPATLCAIPAHAAVATMNRNHP